MSSVSVVLNSGCRIVSNFCELPSYVEPDHSVSNVPDRVTLSLKLFAFAQLALATPQIIASTTEADELELLLRTIIIILSVRLAW